MDKPIYLSIIGSKNMVCNRGNMFSGAGYQACQRPYHV